MLPGPSAARELGPGWGRGEVQTRPMKTRPPALSRCAGLAWPALVLALLLSACQIRQEIRFNRDGSGTASVTVGIDKNCQPLGTNQACSDRLERLLGGEGPVANAQALAESLPFDVRIEPFESGPPESAPEIGYTLSFDFASLEDLEQKMRPDPTTGESQTDAFDIRGVTFEANGAGGFAFTAEVSVPEGGPSSSADKVSFAVVVPGEEGEHNADVAEEDEGSTRFQWNFEAGEEWTTQLQASTCSRGACPGSSAMILIVVVGVVVIAGVVAFILMRRRNGRKHLRASL